MKLWALILAAGTILAFAAPAALAASPSAGFGGSARSANTIQRDGLHSNVAFRDPLKGQTAFVYPLGNDPTPATLRLLQSGKLDDLLAPKPSPWVALIWPRLFF